MSRHIGNGTKEIEAMLAAIKVQSLNELIEQVVPYDIRLPKALRLPAPVSEWELSKKRERTSCYALSLGADTTEQILPQ